MAQHACFSSLVDTLKVSLQSIAMWITQCSHQGPFIYR